MSISVARLHVRELSPQSISIRHPHLVVRIPCQLVGFKHQHVHEGGLSMMQMTDNSNVAYELGEGGHVQQESELCYKAMSIPYKLGELTPCQSVFLACPSPRQSISALLLGQQWVPKGVAHLPPEPASQHPRRTLQKLKGSISCLRVESPHYALALN